MMTNLKDPELTCMLSYIDYETAVLTKLCNPSAFEEVPEPEELVAAKKKEAFFRQTYWQVRL
jgi:hypothetical protein